MISNRLITGSRRLLPFTFRLMMCTQPMVRPLPRYALVMVPNRRFGCEEGVAGPDTFKTMEMKLKEAFQPVSCQVLNPNGDFNSAVIKIVSSSFEGKLPVARHRMVNEVLKNEIKMIHAVQIDAKTPAQANK